MGTGVEEVDKYVSEVKSLLKNAREINLKGLDFARLYKRAKVLDKAISWLASYLTENEGDFSANKLMGQLYEEKGVLDKAVHFYRRSLELNNSQHDLVLKVADLYCQVPIHPERAWAWADRAARLHPGHPVVFKLKMHLLETAGKIDYDQMEDLLAEEMARRPDAELHIRLVKIYAARGCLLDAYTHCTAVVKTKAFADDLEWWACAMDIFERQLCQQLKLMPSSHGVTEANAHMLAAQARMIDLYLKQGSTQECLDALYRFDYSLSQAHKLKAPLRKELRRTTEWDVALHEMLGQLYMSCAVLILRLAKENYLTWPRAVKLSCACFNVSAHIIEPDTKTAWVAKATKDKDPLRWYRMACTRLSTTGHFLLLQQSKEGTEWLESCLQDWSSQKGLHDILDTIYQRKKDLTKSFLAQDPSLFNSTLRIPSVDELVRYDEVRIDDQPRNLNQITWIGLNWLLYEGCMRPGVGVIVKRMFEKLPDDWIKIEDCSPRSLCHRDLEAFIYAVVRTSEERVLQDKESYHPDGQPKILPIQLCDSVVLPQQVAWWDAAISVYRGIRSYVDSGKVRHILHKGLEVLRVTCNHGMHLTLLVYLAENFAEKASFLQKAGAYPWSYEAHWMSLKARSGLYWKEVLKILERTETPPVVKDPLFPSLDTGEPKCVQAVWEKAHCALGEHAFREGRVEEAIELLEPVKSIRGMFHLAQVYCYLATVEIQAAASEDLDSEGCPHGPPEEYYIDLNHAKELLENCLKQATSEAAIKSVQQSMKKVEDMMKMKHDPQTVITPRRLEMERLDSHPLDSQASRSVTPVSAQGSDNFWLDQPGGSSNAELIAQLSEVTLSNGYLQEQMALRDQKMELLSDKVLRLEAELTELKRNSMSSSMMTPSRPSVQPSSMVSPVPIAPHHGTPDSHALPQHTPQGEDLGQAAYQSTPISKPSVKSRLGPRPAPVPEPPKLDPSFFAGLAATNSPEKRQEEEDASELGSTRHDSASADDGIHFEPVVSLPSKVPVTTGEEKEEVLFNKRAKLFRFAVEEKAWKERGIGNLKILFAKEKEKFRVLMRRDHIYKICANHVITAEMELKPMQQGGATRSWIWTTLADFADETPKVEQFAVRFKLPEEADEFKNVFSYCRERVLKGPGKSKSSTQNATNIASEPAKREDQQSLAEKFAPKPGQWSCSICLVLNNAGTKVCAACGAAKLDDITPGYAEVTASSAPAPHQVQPAFFFKPPAPTTTSTAAPTFSFGIKPAVESQSLTAPTFQFQQASAGPQSQPPSTFNLAPFGVSAPSTQAPSTPAGSFSFAPSQHAFSSAPSTPVFGMAKEQQQKPLTFGNFQKVSPGFAIDDEEDNETPVSTGGQTTGTQFAPASASPAAASAITPQSFWKQDMDEKFAFGNLHRTEPLAGMAPASGTPNVWYPASAALTNIAAGAKGSPNSSYAGSTPDSSARFVTPPSGPTAEENTDLIRSELLGLLQSKTGGQTFGGAGVGHSPLGASENSYSLKEYEPRTPEGEEEEEEEEDWETETESEGEDYSSNEELEKENQFYGSPSGTFMSSMEPVPMKPNQAVIQQVTFTSGMEPVPMKPNQAVIQQVTFTSGMEPVPMKPNQAVIQQVMNLQWHGQDTVRLPESTVPPLNFAESSPLAERKFLTAKSPAKGTKKSDEDCVIVYEIRAAKADRERAERLLLPPNFFNYTRGQPCKGCFGCKGTRSPEISREKSKHSHAGDQEVPQVLQEPSESTTAGPMVENKRPVFGSSAGFGSLTFGSYTASSKEAFGSKSGTKEFPQAGRQLFGSVSGEDTLEEEADAHFKPVIPLPARVQVVTGEENHEVMFSGRAKLYRFNVDLKAWKERGVGDIKLLRDLKSGKGRVIMRRDQIYKLCANHWIKPDMELKSNMGSDRSWVWNTLADFSEEEPSAEQLAIRFKLPETATKFKEAFDELKNAEPISEGVPDNKGKVEEIKTMPSESWECDGCYLSNTLATDTCKACGAERPNKQVAQPSKETVPESPNPPTATEPQEEPSTLTFKFGTDGSKLFGGKPLFTVGRESSGEEKIDEEEVPLNIIKYSPAKSPVKPKTPVKEPTSSLSGFSFGAATPSKFTFRMDLSQKSSPQVESPVKSPAKSPVKVPETPTSPTSPGAASECEDDGPHFEPVIALPKKIEVRTGEEEEVIVYSHRAKLYRHDKESAQWKERGLGDVKILKNPRTLKCRVLMRRENVLKICANHQITPVMHLEPMRGCDRAWVWHVLADFSDEEQKKELFAIRFKTVGIAQDFKKAFEDARESSKSDSTGSTPAKDTCVIEDLQSKSQDPVSNSVSTPKSKDTTSSNGETPSVVYCKEANDEEKEKAGKLKLPETFFAGEAKERIDAVQLSSSTETKSPTEKSSKPFLFGSPSVSSLSFASVAGAGTSPFISSDGSAKPFANAGAKLFEAFGSPESGQDIEEPHFEPIIPLPEKIEVKTGEEHEKALFSHRAKLYRYDSNAKQWKERGIGDIKLLSNPQTGRVRVLMRRDQVLKICANHLLTPDMTIKPNAGSDKSLVWSTVADYAEEESKPEQFAVRFKHAETATLFRKTFEESVQVEGKIESGAEGGGDTQPKSIDAEENTDKRDKESLSEKFKAKPGEWDCETCLVRNTAESKTCPACQTPKPGAQQTSHLTGVTKQGGSTPKFSFGIQQPASQPSEATAAVSAPSQRVKESSDVTGTKDSLDKFKPKPGEWDCEMCLVHNTADCTICPACQTPKLGAPQPSIAPSSTPQFGFGVPKQDNTTPKFSFGTQPSGTTVASSSHGQEEKASSNVSTSQGSLLDKFKPKPGEWDCETCLVHNAADCTICPACQTPKPGEPQTSQPTAPKFSFGVTKQGGTTPKFSFGVQQPASQPSEATSSVSGTCQQGKDSSDITGNNDSLLDKFKPKPGEWDCETCLVHNAADCTICPACQTPKPGEPQTSQPTAPKFSFGVTKQGGTTPKFSFGVQQPASQPSEATASVSGTCQQGKDSSDITGNNDSLLDKFKPKPGEWDCEMCLVHNMADCTVCPACQTPKPRALQPSNTPFSTPKFGFGVPKQDNATPKFSFGTQPTGATVASSSHGQEEKASSNVSTSQGSLLDKFKPKPGEWDCETCLVHNAANSAICPACQTPKPSAEQTTQPPAVTPQFSVGIPKRGDMTPQFSFGVKPQASQPASSSFAGFTTQKEETFPSKITFGVQSSGFGSPVVQEVKKTEKANPVLSPPKFQFGTAPMTAGEPICQQAKDGEKAVVAEEDRNDSPNDSTDSDLILVSSVSPTSDEVKQAEVHANRSPRRSADVLLVASVEPTTDEVKRAEALLLPSSFFLFERSKSEETSTERKPRSKSVDYKLPAGSQDPQNVRQQETDPKESTSTPKSEHVFGSTSATSYASFGDVAGQGFKAKDSKATFAGQGSQLFAEPQCNDSPETEADGIYFAPLVSLPKVEVVTGEENEEALFSHRAKLYRYDKDSNQWKERGVGDIKILKNATDQKCRILMRRDQIRKLCANHNITSEMKLLPMSTSDRAWVWTSLADLSEEEPKVEQLAVKFKSPSVAHQFKDVFEKAQQRLNIEEIAEKIVRDSSATNDGDKLDKQPPGGSEAPQEGNQPNQEQRWDCASCGCVNSAKSHQCFGCSLDKVGLEKPAPKSMIQDLSEKWQCDSCYVHHPDERGFCLACGNSRYKGIPPSDEQSKRLQQPEGTDEQDAPNSPEKAVQSEPVKPFLFGAPSVSSVSFNDITTSGIGPGFFSRPPQQPEEKESEEANEQEQEHEHDTSGDHIHFEPIIPLPDKVERVTGEEADQEVFKWRAKLYRFDVDTKAWKDRGIGDIKILQNVSSGKARIVMRREHIHKLCANHLINASMELTPLGGSDREWVWQTLADISEEEAKPEQLAVRFKNAEIAALFKEKFDACKGGFPTDGSPSTNKCQEKSECKSEEKSEMESDKMKLVAYEGAPSKQSPNKDVLPKESYSHFSTSSTVTQTSTQQMKFVQQISSGSTVIHSTERSAVGQAFQKLQVTEKGAERTKETQSASTIAIQDSQISSSGRSNTGQFQFGFGSPPRTPPGHGIASPFAQFGGFSAGLASQQHDQGSGGGTPLQGADPSTKVGESVGTSDTVDRPSPFHFQTQPVFGQPGFFSGFGKPPPPLQSPGDSEKVRQESKSLSATQSTQVIDKKTITRKEMTVQQAAHVTRVGNETEGASGKVLSCSPEITRMLDDLQESSKAEGQSDQ